MGVICFYVSGHGFGHLSRTVPILEAFERHALSDCVGKVFGKLQIILCTPHSPKCFPSDRWPLFGTAGSEDAVIRYRPVSSSMDGVVQSDALQVDAEATLERLQKDLLTQGYDHLVVEERNWLRQVHASLVVADVCFFPAAASKQCGIPFVLVSNFLWDSIYDGVALYQRQMRLLKEQDAEPFLHVWKTLLEKVQSSYQEAQVWFRHPGSVPSACFPSANVSEMSMSQWLQLDPLQLDAERRYIVDIPAMVRWPLEFNRHTTWRLLYDLHATEWSPFISQEEFETSRKLWVSFGGHSLPSSFAASLPEGWIALLVYAPGQQSQSPPVFSAHNRILAVNGQHPRLYFPDLLYACDVVLGKLGFGTCGECLVAGTPMIYVKRQGFSLEEEGLRTWLHNEHHGVVEMTRLDFEQGHWSACVLEAFSLKTRNEQEYKKQLDRVKEGPSLVQEALLHFLLLSQNQNHV